MIQSVDFLLYSIFGDNHDLPKEFKPRWKRHLGKKQLILELEEVLDTLKPRLKRVIKRRYLQDVDRLTTQKEIGKEFYITDSMIQQMEAKALRILRYPSHSQRLKDFYPGSLTWRIAYARYDLYKQLLRLYPQKVAYTVANRVKLRDLRQAFKSTEAALKSSCGIKISSCLHCGKPLPPGWNFCDFHCRSKWKAIPIVCDGCGTIFYKKVYNLIIKKNGQYAVSENMFCTRSCYLANMKRVRKAKRRLG